MTTEVPPCQLNPLLFAIIISQLSLYEYCFIGTTGKRLTQVLDSKCEGSLTVCPGDLVSLICTHSNTGGEPTRWMIRYSGGYTCTRLVSHVLIMDEDQCGPLTFTMISDNTGPTVTSTALMTVTEEMDGALVSCKAGALLMSPQVGNTTIHVIGEVLLIV